MRVCRRIDTSDFKYFRYFLFRAPYARVIFNYSHRKRGFSRKNRRKTHSAHSSRKHILPVIVSHLEQRPVCLFANPSNRVERTRVCISHKAFRFEDLLLSPASLFVVSQCHFDPPIRRDNDDFRQFPRLRAPRKFSRGVGSQHKARLSPTIPIRVEIRVSLSLSLSLSVSRQDCVTCGCHFRNRGRKRLLSSRNSSFTRNQYLSGWRRFFFILYHQRVANGL